MQNVAGGSGQIKAKEQEIHLIKARARSSYQVDAETNSLGTAQTILYKQNTVPGEQSEFAL